MSAAEAPTAGPTGSRAMDPRSSLVLGTLLVVCASAAAFHTQPEEAAPDEVNLRVPPWGEDRGEAASLDATLKARLQAAKQISEEDSSPILEAYGAYNLKEMNYGDGSRW